LEPVRLLAADPPGALSRRLEVRGQPLRTVTESPGADALLHETFTPAGLLGVTLSDPGPAKHPPPAGPGTGPDPEPDLTVVDLVRTPGEIRELITRAAAGAATRTYELTRGYHQPRHDSDTHTLFVLRDVNSEETAAVLRAGKRAVVVRPPSGLGDRWLTRLVRDTATRIAKAGGSLVLHSSAFVHDGGAHLVIGDSGAGKSTTAIALARLLPGAGWMGNDRMHLDAGDDGRYRVTACPLPLAVNKGSLDVMGVTGFASWPVRAGLPGPGSDWDRFQGEDKLKLSSREVSRFLGVEVVPAAPLAGVILPRIDRDADHFLGPAEPGWAADVIRRNCFSLDDNLYGEDWLKVPVRRPAGPPSFDAFLGHLNRLPLLRCSLGSAADIRALADGFREAVRA
jgi:hypothetical protein